MMHKRDFLRQLIYECSMIAVAIIVLFSLIFFALRASAQTYIKGPALIEGVTTISVITPTTTLTKDSQTVEIFTGSNPHTVVLPDVSTIPIGRPFYIANRTTQTLTVNDSTPSLVTTILPDMQKYFIRNTLGAWDVFNVKIDLASSSNVIGVLPIANGGTGQSSFAAGVLHSNGTVLSSSAVSLTADVSGVLPIANGGTNASTASQAFNNLSPMTTGGDLIYGGASGAGTRLPNGTAGQVLTSSGGTAAPVWDDYYSNTWTVNGIVSFAGISLGAAAVYTEATGGSMTLTPHANSQPMAIMCNLNNAPSAPSTSPTTCPSGTESVGFTATLPRIGWYRICYTAIMDLTVNSAGAGNSFTVELFETGVSNQVQIQRSYAGQRGYVAAGVGQWLYPASACSNLYFSSSGQKGFRLLYIASIGPSGAVGFNTYSAGDASAVNFSMNYIGR